MNTHYELLILRALVLAYINKTIIIVIKYNYTVKLLYCFLRRPVKTSINLWVTFIATFSYLRRCLVTSRAIPIKLQENTIQDHCKTTYFCRDGDLEGGLRVNKNDL